MKVSCLTIFLPGFGTDMLCSQYRGTIPFAGNKLSTSHGDGRAKSEGLVDTISVERRLLAELVPQVEDS